MANTNAAAIAVTSDWIDLVASNGALASVDLTLQFNGAAEGASAVVVLGGAAPAAGAEGVHLRSGESVACNAAAIWVRSDRGGTMLATLGVSKTFTVSGTMTATGNVAAGVADSGNPVKVGGKYNLAQPTLADGQRGDVQLSARGELLVKIMSNTAALSDGTGVFTVPKPVTAGGLSLKRLVGATSGVIKAAAGQLYSGTFSNSNAALRYLQIYDKATAGTLSTDTPVMTVPLPPNVSVMVDLAAMGGAFATGISWQVTTDDIAIPTTAGATTDIHGFVGYK